MINLIVEFKILCVIILILWRVLSWFWFPIGYFTKTICIDEHIISNNCVMIEQKIVEYSKLI